MLGIGYLEIGGLTISHVLKLLEIDQMMHKEEKVEEKSEGLTMAEAGALMNFGGLKHGRR